MGGPALGSGEHRLVHGVMPKVEKRTRLYFAFAGRRRWEAYNSFPRVTPI